MAQHTLLETWDGRVAAAFPQLSKPQATVLGHYSLGTILADRCGLSSVAAHLAPLLGRGTATVRSRLQEFYQPAAVKSGRHRRELDVAGCFAPLLAWTVRGWPSRRLALALDATALGDRLVVLSVSVVYRGEAMPVAWKVLPANVRRPWKPEWIALLRSLRGAIPAGWMVVAMTDRGLYARWLFEEIVALGWHPLMRITRRGGFRPDGSKRARAAETFAAAEGRRWKGSGTAFPRKGRRRLRCTLLASREPGYAEPCLVLTDLAPEWAEVLWYQMRGWTEHGFRLLKSDGWHWDASRMTDPERASRLWLVLAVATRYIVAIGGEADAADEPADPGPSRPTKGEAGADGRPRGARPRRTSGTAVRPVSVLRRGLAEFLAALAFGHALPAPHWKPEPWPEIRTEKAIPRDSPPTPVPKNPSL
jgi:hypothetical protein